MISFCKSSVKKIIKIKAKEVKLHAKNDQYWMNTKPWITESAGTFRW